MKKLARLFTINIALAILLASASAQTPNPASISGSISLPDEVYKALSAQHGQNLLTSGIKFEVWKVVYRDVMVKSGAGSQAQTRLYLREKSTATVTASLNPSGANTNINFTVKNIPQQGNFILLYYFTAYPTQFKVFKPGSKVNDGSNRPAIRYAANAPLKIGANKKYGIISIRPVGNPQDYAVNVLANTSGTVVFGLFGDIVDFFEDVGEAIFEGGKTLAGVIVDAAGTIIVQGYGIVQALVTDDGVIIPRYREITSSEYEWANAKIFNNTLPSKGKIIITNLLGAEKRPVTFPTGAGPILVNIGKKGYDAPLTIGNNGSLFIHELTHVWQIVNTADVAFVVKSIKNQVQNSLGDGVYDYTCGKQWSEYNFEQQASIAAALFIKRESGSVSSCEQDYVVANIRKNAPFRTAECQGLVNAIASKRRDLTNRENQLKAAKLKEAGETVVLNADGSVKVGSQKGTAAIQISQAELMKDARYKALKTELEALQQKKIAINCR
jgi:hypothetical protein